MHTRRAIGAAAFALAMVTAGACYDFNAAVDECLKIGRCAPDDAGVHPEDAGSEDAGPVEDGGTDRDGGLSDGGADGGTDAGGGNCANGFTLAAAFRTGGWEWEHPLPQGNPLHAVSGWGTKVWIGGNSGVLMEIDACRIRQLELPVSTAIRSIGRRGEDYFVVVGDTGANYEYRGGTPSRLLSAAFGATESLRTVGVGPEAALYARSNPGVGESPIYVDTEQVAQGVAGPDGQTVISASGTLAKWWVISLDNRAWVSDAVLPGGWTEQLAAGPPYHDVWVSNLEQEAWIAGDDGYLWSTNGITSDQQGAPAQFVSGAGGAADLVAVWGAQNTLARSQDVYAAVSAQGDLYRRLGKESRTWSHITRSGGGSFVRGGYEDVWVRPFDSSTNAGGEVWAVGSGGAIVTNASEGGAWREVTGTFSNVGQVDLTGVAGVGNDVFAVGGSRVLQRGAGGRWNQFDPQPPGGNNLKLRDIAVLAADHLFAVGDDTTLLEYANNTWTAHGIQALGGGQHAPGDTHVKLRAISTAGQSAAWVVGTYYDPSTSLPRGFAATWNQATNKWTEVNAGATELLHVSAVSPTMAWAVGANTVVQLGGTTPTEYLVATRNFESIYAHANGSIFVGGLGFIGQFNAGTPATVSDAQLPDGGTLKSQNFWDVTLSANGPLFVGGSGAAMVLDGGTVYPIEPGTTNHLRGVWVNLTNDTVWAVGDDATIVRRVQ